MPELVTAPFTPVQVAALNKWQANPIVHPFTCGDALCRAELVAYEDGWRCPRCSYRQNWAHAMMLVPHSGPEIKAGERAGEPPEVIEFHAHTGECRYCHEPVKMTRNPLNGTLQADQCVCLFCAQPYYVVVTGDIDDWEWDQWKQKAAAEEIGHRACWKEIDGKHCRKPAGHLDQCAPF